MDPFTCSLAVLVSAALGGGSDTRALPMTMQDDALLLHGSNAQVHSNAQRMARLGVDRVRLTASWFVLAPQPEADRMPAFDPRESQDYPREPWARLDRAVKAVTDAGLEPQIDVAFFAPRWAVKKIVRTRHPHRYRWKPDPIEFGHFAEAVASRYSGRHRDPAHPQEQLPPVRLWGTWNEPNHPAFLLPQWERKKGHWVPRSPHVYRRLHNRAYDAIKGVDPANKVLLGGVSAEGMPEKGPRKTIPPLRFLRELACVDGALRPRHTRDCRNFRPLRGDGFSAHPYSLYGPPNEPSPERDYVRMGDLKNLSDLLEALYQRGRLATRQQIYVTEYGYETNPPDVTRGVSLRTQARYLSQATYLAWSQPDIETFAQFLLEDIPPPAGTRPGSEEAALDWHSGLYFYDGRPKPAVQAFKIPFWAEARWIAGQGVVVLFGQIREADGAQLAEVQRHIPGGTWEPVRSFETGSAPESSCDDSSDETEFMTDSEGFFHRVAPYEEPSYYRARWAKPDGTSEYGVPIRVGPPRPWATASER